MTKKAWLSATPPRLFYGPEDWDGISDPRLQSREYDRAIDLWNQNYRLLSMSDKLNLWFTGGCKVTINYPEIPQPIWGGKKAQLPLPAKWRGIRRSSEPDEHAIAEEILGHPVNDVLWVVCRDTQWIVIKGLPKGEAMRLKMLWPL